MQRKKSRFRHAFCTILVEKAENCVCESIRQWEIIIYSHMTKMLEIIFWKYNLYREASLETGRTAGEENNWEVFG